MLLQKASKAVVGYVLAMVLIAGLLSACSRSGRETGGGAQEPVRPPRIGAVILEPAGEPGPKGTRIIPEWVGVSVEAAGARRVEFYAAPVGEDGPGVLFWDDDRPEDGWRTGWQVPVPDTVFRLTVVAHWETGTARSSVEVMWKSEGITPEQVPGPDGLVPFRLLDDASLEHIDGLPRFFLAEGWLDNRGFYGLTGTTPIVVGDRDKGGFSVLNVTAWQTWLSPDGKRVAYLNDGGIHVIGTDGAGKRRLWPERVPAGPEGPDGPEGPGGLGETAQGAFWSPDGRKLLLWYEYEWDADYFILDLETGGTKPVDTKLDGYFLTDAVGWAGDRTLVFSTRAGRKKDGTQEYNHGYRSDLAVYDLVTGRFGLITGADDGEFIEGIAAGSAGILFRRADRRGSRERLTHGLMDISGHVKWEEDLGDVRAIALSDDDRLTYVDDRLAYVVETGSDEMNTVSKLVVWSPGGSMDVATLLIGDSLRGLFWSPDGDRLLLSFSSLASLAEPPGSYRAQYHTLVITVGRHAGDYLPEAKGINP